MANTFLLKRSATASATPSAGQLSAGELAINIADGKLFAKKSDNSVVNLPVTSISGQTITPGIVGIGVTTPTAPLQVAAGNFAANADAQRMVLVARRATTDATANQVLFLDNSAARLTVPAKTTWMFTAQLSAYNDTDSGGAGWFFRGAICRNGANGTALVDSLVSERWQDSTMVNATATVVADDTNEALEIRVTGIAAKNIRWVAVVDITQCSYGTP